MTAENPSAQPIFQWDDPLLTEAPLTGENRRVRDPNGEHGIVDEYRVLRHRMNSEALIPGRARTGMAAFH